MFSLFPNAVRLLKIFILNVLDEPH